MTYVTSFLLGLVQGVAEFLPISSSGHLAIAQNLLGLEGAGSVPEFFDVLLHLGTLIAVFAAYWKDICDMVVEFFRGIGDLAHRSTPSPVPPARRELKEEIGAEAGRWTELGALIASPGCYGETLYLYMAEDLTFGETHPDEDEFLEVLRVPFEEAVRQCMDGTLTDAKTVAAVLKGRLLRERACAPAADAIH